MTAKMPTFSDEEIAALGSPKAIRRHYEDELDLKMLRGLVRETQAAMSAAAVPGDARLQFELHWPQTVRFGDDLARRPLGAISSLLRSHYEVTVADWHRVRVEAGKLAGAA